MSASGPSGPLVFVPIFMEFSPKCNTKKLEMIYTIFGSFCSFLNWEGAAFHPQIRLRKIPALFLNTYMATTLCRYKIKCRLVYSFFSLILSFTGFSYVLLLKAF